HVVLGLDKDVRHMNDLSFDDRASGEAAAPAWRHGEDPEDRRVGRHIARYDLDQLTIEARDGPDCCFAQAERTLADRLKYWLGVGGRLRDHAQDIAGGRLLLQRLGEVGVLGLQLP